jgi:hypothetical protein
MQLNKHSLINIGLLIATIVVLIDLLRYINFQILLFHEVIIYSLVLLSMYINLQDKSEILKFLGLLTLLSAASVAIQTLKNSYIPIELDSIEGVALTYTLLFSAFIIIILSAKGVFLIYDKVSRLRIKFY